MTTTSAASAERLLFPSQAFDALCEEARVLDTRFGRPGLLAHEDDGGRPLITKLWYPRGALSSDRFKPYSERFVRAAARLAALGVPVPHVLAHGRVADSDTRFVTYEPVAGTPLRELGPQVDVAELARFVLRLHDLGVYFRGLHLGNVIRLSDGTLGLIDIADTRFARGPLSRRQRERNLGILCSHPQDLRFMLEGHWSDIVMAYSSAAGMSLAQAARMRERVRLQVQRRNTQRAAVRRRKGLQPLAGGGYPKKQAERAKLAASSGLNLPGESDAR